MNKKEIILKNLDFIRQKRAEGATLREICKMLEDEYGIAPSPQYISRFLNRESRMSRRKDRLVIYKNHQKIAQIFKTADGYVVVFEKGVEPFCEPGFYEKLPPFLENLLPEGANRELLIQKHRLDPNDEFGLLALCTDTFGGWSAVEPTRTKAPPFPRPSGYDGTILRYIALEKDVREAILDLYFSNSSEILNRLSQLSGAQPKFACSFDGNRLYLPTPQKERSNAFVKVVNKKFRNINLIENLFLHFGRIELGLPAAFTYVYFEKDLISAPSFAKEYSDHLIAQRLDRMDGEVKDVVELVMLMGRRSEEKYDLSIEEMFEFLDSRLVREDLSRLAKYVYYSYLVGNGDFHAKNVAFFKNPLRLAPMYDVVNTKIYGFDEDIGMPFEGSRKIDEVRLVAFLRRWEPGIAALKGVVKRRMRSYIDRTPLDGEVREKLLKSLGLEG